MTDLLYTPLRYAFVLLDAVGYKFRPELFSASNGGQDAARNIHNNTLDLMTRLGIHSPESCIIKVLLYCNKADLDQALLRDDFAPNFAKLITFWNGFSSIKKGSIVDCGSDKESASSALRSQFTECLRLPQAEIIILGCCHDDGYIQTMSEYYNDPIVRDRVYFLKGEAVDVGFMGQDVHFVEFSNVFRDCLDYTPNTIEIDNTVGYPQMNGPVRREAGSRKRSASSPGWSPHGDASSNSRMDVSSPKKVKKVKTEFPADRLQAVASTEEDSTFPREGSTSVEADRSCTVDELIDQEKLRLEKRLLKRGTTMSSTSKEASKDNIVPEMDSLQQVLGNGSPPTNIGLSAQNILPLATKPFANPAVERNLASWYDTEGHRVDTHPSKVINWAPIEAAVESVQNPSTCIDYIFGKCKKGSMCRNAHTGVWGKKKKKHLSLYYKSPHGPCRNGSACREAGCPFSHHCPLLNHTCQIRRCPHKSRYVTPLDVTGTAYEEVRQKFEQRKFDEISADLIRFEAQDPWNKSK